MNRAVYSPLLPRIESFPHAVVATATGMIHVSAQAAFDHKMNIVGVSDIAAQTRQCLVHIDAILKHVEFTRADLLSSIAYVVDLDDLKLAEYMRAFGAAVDEGLIRPHATTLVGVTRLPHPQMAIEISAVALRSKRQAGREAPRR